MARTALYDEPPKSVEKLYPMSMDEFEYHTRKHKGQYLAICAILGNPVQIQITQAVAVKIARQLESLNLGVSCYKDQNLPILYIVGISRTTDNFMVPLQSSAEATQPIQPSPQTKVIPEPDYDNFPKLEDAKKALLTHRWPELLIHWHYLCQDVTLDIDDKDLMGIIDREQLEALIEVEEGWNIARQLEEDD